jgi:hypothetical protein
MAALPYKPVSFGKEPVLADKVNTLANNIQWVYENMPQAKYVYSGVVRTSGVKILAGNVYVAANKKPSATATVNFNSFFSVGCKPCVVVTVNATPQMRYMANVRNINGSSVQADHLGFQVHVASSELDPRTSYIRYALYVNYIAVGW